MQPINGHEHMNDAKRIDRAIAELTQIRRDLARRPSNPEVPAKADHVQKTMAFLAERWIVTLHELSRHLNVHYKTAYRTAFHVLRIGGCKIDFEIFKNTARIRVCHPDALVETQRRPKGEPLAS